MKKTCFERYGTETPLQNEIIYNKLIETNLNKYGYVNVFQNDFIKEKIKGTNIEKYGTEFYKQSLEYKQIFIDNYIKKYGLLPSDRNLQFKYYRSKVTNFTNKNKDNLLKNWNGYDFYDNEYIKDNFNLHSMDKNYPTIDHKISVFFGFNNNILPENISEIENLCITKKSLNSIKNYKCYEREKEN